MCRHLGGARTSQALTATHPGRGGGLNGWGTGSYPHFGKSVSDLLLTQDRQPLSVGAVPPDPRPDWVRDRRREIGHRLARWRASRHWSAYDLAAESGVSRLSVIRAENATHSTGLDVLLQFADAFGVTVGQLLDEEPPQPPARG